MLATKLSDFYDTEQNPRLALQLNGRYMLPNKQEYTCRTQYISVRSLTIIGDGQGKPGERIIAYIDVIGRLEGVIQKLIAGGFIMSIALPPAKTTRLAEQLNWLLKKGTSGAAQDRRHERIELRHSLSTLKLDNDLAISCNIVDISVSGASVSFHCPDRPEIGSRVILGHTPGRVSRILDYGVAIEFLRLIPIEHFNKNMIV